MAVATGSQIRPELSAVNYTPYLQATGQAAQMQARGAENIAAGLANLGQQAGAAIKEYYAKKESKQLEDDAISLISTKIEKNQSLGDFIGVKRDKDGVLDKKALRVAVKTVGVPAILSAAKSLDEEEKLKGLFSETNAAPAAAAIQGGASFEQLPTGAAAYKPAPISVQQFIERATGAGVDPNKIAGVANAMVNAREAELRGQPKPRDPLELAQLEAQTLRDLAMAKKTTAEALIVGQPKPLTPSENLAERKFQEEQKAKTALKEEAESKKLAQAADHKSSIINTISNINSAIALYESGAGGGIRGIEAIGFMASQVPFFEDKSMVANNLIGSIKSALSLEQINRMKEFSKTGATGFGSFSDKEGSKVESSIATLDPKLPREEIIKRLKQVKGVLMDFGIPSVKGKQATDTLQIKSIKVVSPQ